GKKYGTYLSAGQDNVKLDVFVSDKAAYARNAEMLQALKKIPETEEAAPRRQAALVDLYLTAQQSLFPDGVVDDVHEVTTAVGAEVEKDMADVRQALAPENKEDVKKTVQAIQTKYAKTKAKAWFGDALACAQIKQTQTRIEEQRASGKPPSATAVDTAVKS